MRNSKTNRKHEWLCGHKWWGGPGNKGWEVSRNQNEKGLYCQAQELGSYSKAMRPLKV